VTIQHDLLTLLPELILAVGAMAALLIGALRGDKATKFLSGLVVLLMAAAAYFVLTARMRAPSTALSWSTAFRASPRR